MFLFHCGLRLDDLDVVFKLSHFIPCGLTVHRCFRMLDVLVC